MKASAYQECGEEYKLVAVKCAENDYLPALNEECSHKVYKSLRLAKSARTQLEKWTGRKYALERRTITYTPWERVEE